MTVTLTQHASLLDSDLETPVGLFFRLAGEGRGILLESAEVDGRWGRHSLVAADFLLVLRCVDGKLSVTARDTRLLPLTAHHGAPFCTGLRALMRDLAVLPDPRAPGHPPITRALYGYLGYGVAGLLEPRLAPALPPEEAEACLALPGTVILFDHGYNRISRISLLDGAKAPPLPCGEDAAPPPPPLPAGQAGPGEAYLRAVRKAKEYIREGECIQVVLSTPFHAPLEGNPFSLYRRLRRINPSPYMFYMRLPGLALLGSSPEALIGCEAGQLRLCPIAGTRPRSADAAQDAIFGDELTEDPKERAEHVMLVDLGRNDLGRVAEPGSVHLDRFMEVERFSHVMHLTSRISARLREGRDALDILAASFPAGTVSGAPKIRAMEIIAELEERPRGPYAGAVGWLGLDKESVHLDLGITIRSLWVRDGRIHWQAGAGIVFDSDPEKERLECMNKAEAMRTVVRDVAGGAL